MAKERKGLKSTLNLGAKVALPKKKVANKNIDEIATKLVNTVIDEPKEVTKRLSIDVPETMYKAIKMKVFSEGQTVREYVLNLITNDLK